MHDYVRSVSYYDINDSYFSTIQLASGLGSLFDYAIYPNIIYAIKRYCVHNTLKLYLASVCLHQSSFSIHYEIDNYEYEVKPAPVKSTMSNITPVRRKVNIKQL